MSTPVLFFARFQIGKPFDWAAVFAFAFDRDWRCENAWFCSELVAAALEIGGFWARPWTFPCRANKIDPDDLLLLLGPYLQAP
ncbi:MAG: hypothetical protein ACREE4_17820 [Stellaceae bacterium]